MIHLVPMPEFTIPGTELDAVQCGQCGFTGALARDIIPPDPCAPRVTVNSAGELEMLELKPEPTLQGN